MAWNIPWKVLVDGRDFTDAMQPFLTAITVSDKDGTASDTCSLEFDDTGGQVMLPHDGAKISVHLQGVPVFDGISDIPRSSGSRGGGRTLSVGAKGFDARGKVKQLQAFHLDDGNLQEFLDKGGEAAGLSQVVIDPAFASIVRDYWSADGESFLHLGQRLARELGGTFKVRGDKAVLAKRGSGASAAGGAMPTIQGRVPGNVISWTISPRAARRQFKAASVRYFDRRSGTVMTVDVDTGLKGGEALNSVRSMAADEGSARAIAEGRKADSEREGGDGSVEIDIAVEAQAEGTFVLSGARSGIDGTYRIVSVTHKADRCGGSTTSLELKQPGDGAGKDSRTGLKWLA